MTATPEPNAAASPAARGRKQCWLDLRDLPDWRTAAAEEALHQRFDAVVASDVADLAPLPPTIRRVLAPAGPDLPDDLGNADLVLVDPAVHGDPAALKGRYPDVPIGGRHEVTDAASLDVACDGVRHDPVTLIRFRDPTNIPMEIVLAAADGATGTIVTAVDRVEDAEVHLAVLEHGPDAVLLAPAAPGDATRLAEVVRYRPADLRLTTFTVTAVRHAGRGDRACVDTCSYLRPDEGILTGSRSRALLLCVSETHPLPYMPTRPFRVNAGAVMSYTLAGPERTRYLSELGAGDTVLAVGADGRTRRVTVGRVKIETRPLLSMEAVAPGGERANLIVQDDWHVRVLGPGATVLNSTELKPGDEILGYLPGRDRHVGYPIDEQCYEQ
ncbi:3-dehydroquinate synthase II [Actinoplanes sp. NPDC051411]|uniref:3-dehydroquinate synthase II n=1 Tax=Actinoplanes sp. NPDC051411 TaxID=3155522 RepID=UPI0034269FC9